MRLVGTYLLLLRLWQGVHSYSITSFRASSPMSMKSAVADLAYPNKDNNNNINKIRRLLLAQLFLLATGSPPALAASFNLNQNSNEMKAWTCHGRNQKELVDRLCQAKIIQSPAVRDVMYEVDRKYYVPQNPYMDAPQAIGLGQTISAPHMHAHVLEEMYPYLQRQIQKQQSKQPTTSESGNGGLSSYPHVKMLDVGCGSGYLTAALGRWIQNHGTLSTPQPGDDDSNNDGHNTGDGTILGATGKVFGIDVYPHLINLTTRNMQQADGDLLEANGGVVKVQLGDGWKGLAEEAPFDAIHVGAAAEELPVELLQQLKVGGVLIVPVGAQGDVQTLYRVVRTGNSTSEASSGSETPSAKDGIKPVENERFSRDDFRITQLLGVRYVPLVHPTNLDG